jgi:hypothetical protein
MIDEVTLHIGGGKADLSHFDHYRRRDTNTAAAVAGNMGIRQTLDGLTVWGSLGKYLNGQNVTVLTRAGVEAAIIKLEKELTVDLSAAVVRRVSIGASIITKSTPSEYLELFNRKATTKKDTYSKQGFLETVSFGTNKGSFQFCAYDKTIETEAESIPELYQKSNVLRLENRIINRKGIQAVFNRDLSAYELFDYDIYRKLQSLFLTHYKRIEKTGRQVYIDKSKKITPAHMERLAAAAYRQTHPQDYTDFLQRVRAAGTLTKDNLKQIRKTDRKIDKDITLSSTNPLIAELDAKLESYC